VEALEASLGDKVRVVPKGLSLTEEAEFPLRKVFGIPPERAVFLLAGGLRPVKGQLRAIFALDGLGVELVLAGPALDPEYSGAVRREASSRPWVRMIEVRPHARMAGAYRDCDVVLNCSAVEGMPNALVEAMHFGRAILASDVPGNRSLVEPAVNGLLFAGDDDLRAKARDLAGNPALRATLGAAGAIRAKANHDAVAEARALMQIYREAAGDGRGGG
jgi:glycosyltransferase involved in cell wall biosynthesis